MLKARQSSGIVLMVLAAGALIASGCATPARGRLRGVSHDVFSARGAAGQAAEPAPAPSLAENPTLSEYLTYAEQNNAGLQSAYQSWQAAVQRVPQAESLPDPSVAMEFAPMERELSVSQMLPFYGKRALRGSAAAEEANAAFDRYEATRQELLFRVKEAYYEYQYLKHALDEVNANEKLLESLEEAIRIRYQAGTASNADLLRLHVELGKLVNERASLEDSREPVMATLNAALSRPSDAPLPWPAETAPESSTLDAVALLRELSESNPELRAMTDEIEKAKLQIDLAKKEYYPDLMLGLKYTDVDEVEPMMIEIPAPPPADPSQPPSPPQQVAVPPMPGTNEDFWSVMVSFNLPIWYGRLRAGVAEAESTLRASEASRRDKENMLTAQLKMALYKVRDARRQIGLYRDTLLPRAEQALRAAQTAYAGGSAPFADLIDAQRTLLAFNLAYHRAVADQQQRIAEVEMLLGGRLNQSNATDMTERSVDNTGIATHTDVDSSH